MTMTILTAILATAVTAGTPLLFAALGEILTERAGILNLGVEGMMLVGAVSGFASAYYTGNPWLGVAVAMVAGGLMALIHAFLSVTMRANQVVSGLALTMFGTGLSSYLGKVWGVVGNPFPNHFRPVQVPGLAEIPLLGQVLFHQDVLVLASFVLAAGIWFLLYRTRTGMNLRAVGEKPAAADSLGINVFALRYLFTIAGGMLAGLAGAYFSLAYVPTWMENITAGRGWIAVALVIFATWNPAYAVIGAYSFGGIDALGFRLQALDIAIPSYFLKMLPYLATVLVLVLVSKRNLLARIGAPGALGLPYDREER